MRFVIIVLILGLAAFTAHAVSYSNDSDSIDIDYSGGTYIPDAVDEDSQETEDSNETDSNDQSDTSSDAEQQAATQGNSDTFAEDSSDVTIAVSVVDENGESLSQNATPGNSVEDILNSLFGNQALFFNGGFGSGASESITLSGEQTRAALAARGVGALSIADLLGRRFLSKKDFALVAASSILDNKAIEEVILTLDTLSLTYRSQGRLFAVFPLSYPIKLSINPHGTTPEERVGVKFPWYRFFLRTYVSRTELQRDLSAAIERAIQNGTESIDAKTRLFIEVTTAVKARFDTVDESLR